MEEIIESIPRWLKISMIFLSGLIVVLGTIIYIEMFGVPFGISYTVISQPPATNTPSSLSKSSPTNTSVVAGISSSTASSTSVTLPNATDASLASSEFTTSPLSWTDGGATFSITAVTLSDNQLSFSLTIQIGDSPACVPLNLRLIADESGNLKEPDTLDFALPDSGNCNGAADATYQDQNVTFTVKPASFPLLFTTNNDSGKFFEIVRTAGGRLFLEMPGTSG
ncbi:MAG: hypothetical protein Q8P97_00560 [bacterium]|nr:hypothetical protein [bacterium]